MSIWERLLGRQDIFAPIARGNLARVQALLAADAQAHQRVDANGQAPLHSAAYGGNNEIASALIRAGAKVNARDAFESTPLHWAASGGHVKMIDLLLHAGADMDALDKEGFSPMQIASFRGHKAVADHLRWHGAKVPEK